MAQRAVVAVQIAGHEYRIRSDSDVAWLQRVAGFVDEAMARIRARTEMVDSQDIAVLAALNIARELIELKEQMQKAGGRVGPEPERLRALIELAESSTQVAVEG